MFSKKFVAATKEYSDYGTHIPAPYFRKKLMLTKNIKKAKIRICGLGFYELYVNTKRITKGLLAPYISNPDDILYYDEYDITDLLQYGRNVLGFLLGNGMLNSFGGNVWDFQLASYRSAPKLAFALELEYEDGNIAIIEADQSLKTHPSPILLDDLRCGEIYDARLEITDWNSQNFDDSTWENAIFAETPRGETRLCEAEPIGVLKTLKPVSIKKGHITYFPNCVEKVPVFALQNELKEGYIYDFGENLAGNIRLKIQGERGQKVSLQFGELLADDGGLDLRAMHFQPQRYDHRITYYLKGEGVEEYTPTFTYHGFRYCMVSGISKEQATSELLTYEVMSSELKKKRRFSLLRQNCESVGKSDL